MPKKDYKVPPYPVANDTTQTYLNRLEVLVNALGTKVTVNALDKGKLVTSTFDVDVVLRNALNKDLHPTLRAFYIRIAAVIKQEKKGGGSG